MENITTTRECYDYILNTFNENNIEFVIIRGFRFLPEKMDTDLDIVIHPNSYPKFVEICKMLKKKKLINPNNPVEYTYNNKKFYYHPLVTSKHLTGRYYRFDTYSDLFFYKNGEGKGRDALVLNNLFKYYLFKNKIQKNNYFIPNPIHEVILLLYRDIYDKQGKWITKHTRRISELMNNINDNDFNFVCNMCFMPEQNVLEHIKKKEFSKITEPKQELNLFIIRKQGLVKEVVNDILDQIKKHEYLIIDKILVNIGDSNKFYTNFYSNFEDYEKEIIQDNKNICLVIVTNKIINKNPGHLKGKIRKQYAQLYPNNPGCPGNIIHSSDSVEDCNKELELLFNENITDFKKIGTYYNYHD